MPGRFEFVLASMPPEILETLKPLYLTTSTNGKQETTRYKEYGVGALLFINWLCCLQQSTSSPPTPKRFSHQKPLPRVLLLSFSCLLTLTTGVRQQQ